MPTMSKPNITRNTDAIHRPAARAEDLIIRRLPAETLVYDLRTHRATCLDHRATTVWDFCDGQHSHDEIIFLMRDAGVSADDVQQILDQLADSGLIEGVEPVPLPQADPIDRRRALATLGVSLAASASSVLSIGVPTPAQAASQQTCTSVILNDCPPGFLCQDVLDLKLCVPSL